MIRAYKNGALVVVHMLHRRNINMVKVIRRIPLYCLLLLLLFVGNYANAAITEVQPLKFGTFALVTNNVVSTLKISDSGANPIASIKLYPLVFGQAGHYQLTGYPAWTPLIITIADYQIVKGASEPMTIGSFVHDPVITDGSGEATLKLGATLSTSGTNVVYGDALSSGTMNIVITW